MALWAVVCAAHDACALCSVDLGACRTRAQVNDTVMFDIETGKMKDFIKFDVGQLVMVTGGRNQGRVGTITHQAEAQGLLRHHPRQGRVGHEFATRCAARLQRAKAHWLSPAGWLHLHSHIASRARGLHCCRISSDLSLPGAPLAVHQCVHAFRLVIGAGHCCLLCPMHGGWSPLDMGCFR